MAQTQVSGSGIKDNVITNSHLHSAANIAGSKLANSGVTAGSYGSGSATLSLTINAQGLITAASTNSISTDLVNDTSPQLGGDLDTNSFEILLDDDHKIKFGDDNDMNIRHTGSFGILENSTGALYLRSSSFIEMRGNNNETFVKATENGAVELYHDNSKIFETGSDQATVTGKLTINRTSNNEKLILSGSAAPYIRFQESTTNKAYMQWNDNGYIEIYNQETSKQLRIGGSGAEVLDNVKFTAGNSQDLQIYHDGTGCNIRSTSSKLEIRSPDLILQNSAAEKYFRGISDGAVELYHDNSKMFETLSVGTKTYGQHQISTGDNSYLGLLNTNGQGTAYLRNYKGNLLVESPSNITLEHGTSSEISLYAVKNGSVSLYHDNAKKFETNSTGVHVTGMVTCTTEFRCDDNEKFVAGTGQDLQIYHDGSHSRLVDAGTGYIKIQSSQIALLNADDSAQMAQFYAGGAVDLYHNNSKKFETTNLGAKVTGELRLTDHLIMNAADNLRIYLGAGNDLQIYFDGTVGHIKGISGVQGINVATSNVERYQFTDGSIRPLANNTYDLGTSSLRWQNIYTNDLNLSNEGGANDVDGTYGSYTIQEGHHDLFLINKRTGKKYKFNLTEVS